MINKLVNPVLQMKNVNTSGDEQINVDTRGIKEYALLFVNSLDANKRKRFKNMLNAGISCGESVAKLYNLNTREFMKEVKAII